MRSSEARRWVSLMLAAAPFAMVSGMIVYVHGVGLGLLWQVLPLIFGYLLFRNRKRSKAFFIASVAANIMLLAVIALTYFSWIFNLGNVQYGSTSGVVFIFLPIYFLLLASVIFVMFYALSKE